MTTVYASREVWRDPTGCLWVKRDEAGDYWLEALDPKKQLVSQRIRLDAAAMDGLARAWPKFRSQVG